MILSKIKNWIIGAFGAVILSLAVILKIRGKKIDRLENEIETKEKESAEKDVAVQVEKEQTDANTEEKESAIKKIAGVIRGEKTYGEIIDEWNKKQN